MTNNRKWKREEVEGILKHMGRAYPAKGKFDTYKRGYGDGVRDAIKLNRERPFKRKKKEQPVFGKW